MTGLGGSRPFSACSRPRLPGVGLLFSAAIGGSVTSRCEGLCRARPFGEEAPLTFRRGSGTIFFSNCNPRCIYCQSRQISHRGEGLIIPEDSLGRMMIQLQEQGCHNINLVTPIHYVPSIAGALRYAIALGLHVRLVQLRAIAEMHRQTATW